MTPEDVARSGAQIIEAVTGAVTAPPDSVEQLVVALLAGGHVLIEDLPGVGKTALARALAASTGCVYSRIQCTSDMLPSDVTGVNVFSEPDRSFRFRAGPVFANIVLVDEINRASAKTQSGLLECMQERRVTVDGTTHELPLPFIVVATQNPVDFEGTYPLPAAQLDRFMLRVTLGYPAADAESEMLARHAAGDRVLDIRATVAAEQLLAAQACVAATHASDALRAYVVAVLEATRTDPRIELGASPRAGLQLLRAAMARSTLRGRAYALPDDVQTLATAVLTHRLILRPGVADDERARVVEDAIARVPAL